MRRYFAGGALLLLWAAGVQSGPSVRLDAAWLARQGPAPYRLDRPGTTYTLAADVRAEGTAFIVDAPDIVLDLGGRTVTYGDVPPLAVRNGGFEEGRAREAPGWDLSAAPAAELTANTRYLSGKQVLRLRDFRTPQRLLSAPIAIPQGQRSHAATILPVGSDYRTRLVLRVVDAASLRVLGEGRSNNVERGVGVVVPFVPGTCRSVRLQVEATPPPGKSETLDLDEANVQICHDYGILATSAWVGEVPGGNQIAARVGKLARKAARFTLRNGKVVQGAGRGLGSVPLFCQQLQGVTIEKVEVLVRGMDTSGLDLSRAGGRVVVRHCTFRHAVENITDRSKLFAAIRLSAVQGPIRIEHNRMLDVPAVGILLDGARSAVTLIRHNHIHQRAVVCNGYGLILVGSRQFEIAHNRIIAENGRGIDIDSYRPGAVSEGHLHDNHVEVRETFNREYVSRIEARALRLRNTVDAQAPHRDLLIQGNTFIARTGPGLAQKAFAVRVSYTNRGGSMSRANVRLHGNRLVATTSSTHPESRASALALDGVAAGVDLSVRDNILESNDAALTLADSEGSVEAFTLVGNTWRQSRDGAVRPWFAVHTGYWNRTVRDVRLLDPRLEDGAEARVRWQGTGSKELAFGREIDVAVRRRGQPVRAAQVVVLDREGHPVYRGTTDQEGRAERLALPVTQHQQRTTDPRRIEVRTLAPFTIRVESGLERGEVRVPADGKREIAIDLSGR